ncbi:type I-F CRISPR-associated protein Csy2 [Vibrio sp. SCSIO 43132]|uniref:type I-F CRISPR-associated protein Csy2 n=1 Tax=Vibrio sp. SCSIO 43132 TaxID=2779363 RepID=UPI001CA967B9|nr:type I-F CRISPR-associated protein Csy2 [Vibrio sp. SCSIO 43132]UAB71343.1 type I-F CRISPR-associated protein Csy2 [Vibrio sp. SCSIO 43132]
MTHQYLILKNIRIANANAIAGSTYGFPSVTHFLGYVHALSRKLSVSDGIALEDVGIVCHDHQVHAYRESSYEPYSFALTRNPLTKEGKTAPINEEGRMHLTVSLVIRTRGFNITSEDKVKSQCSAVKTLAESHKLAGGRILSIQNCYLAKSDCHKAILRPLLPGFVLTDQSSLLAEHQTEKVQPLDAWLNFTSIKFEPTTTPLSEGSEQVKWQPTSKPKGYLVPLHVGYKAIAPTYPAGEVANVRDAQTPVSFVEPVHSIGEWVGAPSRLDSLQDMLWHYHYNFPFYVAHTQPTQPDNVDFNELELVFED